MQPVAPLAIDIAPGKTAGPKAAPPITQQDRVTQLLTHKNLFFVLLSFFGFWFAAFFYAVRAANDSCVIRHHRGSAKIP